MKVLMLVVMVGFTLVMIFVGARDAEQYREDKEKFGGDKLIKAISEYNEQSSKLRGHVGAVGVTRTPLSPDYDRKQKSSLRSNKKKGRSNGLPGYMQGTPPESKRNYYPPNPYGPKTYRPKRGGSSGSRSNDAQGGDGYYPPPPLPQDESSLRKPYPPVSYRNKPFTLPMTLPEQQWPEEALQLRNGQKIGFAGTTVYTYDKSGTPMPLPDGNYMVGGLMMHVKNGKKVLPE